MYEQPAAADLSQGDIIEGCPILVWKLAPPPLDLDVPPEIRIIRVVVLTQACDLAQDKTTRVVVAPVHAAADLVAKNILKAGVIRDQVRRGQVFGWYFLPAAPVPINAVVRHDVGVDQTPARVPATPYGVEAPSETLAGDAS